MEDIKNLLKDIVEFFNYTLYDVSYYQIILAILIMMVTLATRKLFVSFVLNFLRKLTKKTKTEWDDKLIEAIDPPARLFIFTIGFMFALKAIEVEISVESLMGRVVRTLIILSLFWTLHRAADIISTVFSKIVKKTETTLDDILLPYANKTIKILIVFMAITVVAKEWQYDIGTLLAGLGIGGLAFALAAQDTIANLFGGFAIMVDRPFKVGDWILTDHVEGTVEEIGFRSTRVRTFSQALVTVSNSKMIGSPITNWSRMGKRRIKFVLGVKYSTTAEQMEELLGKLRKEITNHPDVHPQTIMVYFDNFGDSALEIFIYFFTKTINWQEYLAIKENINIKIMKLLAELNIEVAFPSKSIYIESNATKELRDII